MEDSNVYNLITKLCKNLLEKSDLYPNLLQKNNNIVIKKLRSKAYEILLGKTSKIFNQGKFLALLNNNRVTVNFNGRTQEEQ